MGKRIVIALGGNALGNNLPEQMIAVKKTASAIVDLIEAGNEVVIAHGNGPQVGMIQNAMSELTRSNPEKYIPCPLSVCVAMSQGYIGYDLQNALRQELLDRGINKPCATVLTQVIVDKNDPAFENPTKPIGAFFSESQRDELQKANPDWRFVEDAGRGYRRVVASPEPQRIVEAPAIKALIQQGFVVIGAGGGGIPVVCSEAGNYQSVDAVIDKDLSTALLAREIHADILVITTGVEKVCIHFGKPQQQALDRVDIATMTRYMQEGHFPPGSMLPKIIASLTFLEQGGKEVIITTPECLPAALRGETGTHIIKT